MSRACAVLRVDELEDGMSAVPKVEYLLRAGFRFISVAEFFNAKDTDCFPHDQSAFLVVHSFDLQFAALLSQRLSALAVPFLLVCNSNTLTSPNANWPSRVERILSGSESGMPSLKLGAGVVKYEVSETSVSQVVTDVVRRMAVMGRGDRDRAIRDLEQELKQSSSIPSRPEERSFIGIFGNFESNLVSFAPMPENCSSRLLNHAGFDTSVRETVRKLEALGLRPLRDVYSMPFRHDYWEKFTRAGSAEAVMFAYSFSGHLCTPAAIAAGLVPQLACPSTLEEALQLGRRCVHAQLQEPMGRLSQAHYHGGKRALLKSLRSHICSIFGRYRSLARIEFDRVQRVVFFCKGNINRSAYAACLLKSLAAVETSSFGLSANDSDAASVQALERACRDGLDLTNHITTSFSSFKVRDGDLIVGFEPGHVALLSRLVHAENKSLQFTLAGLWSQPKSPYVQDPIVRSEQYYERCFDLIASSVNEISRLLAKPVHAGAV